MSSRFESWFLYFVAEHSSPAATSKHAVQMTGANDEFSEDAVQAAAQPLPVSNDNSQVQGLNVLLFRPRETHVENNLSVA